MIILITGGTGFIGSNLVQHLVREHPGDQLINLDSLGDWESLAAAEVPRVSRVARGCSRLGER